MAVIGFVDACDDGVLMGWARDPERPEPVQLEILCDGVLLGCVSACLYREDLRDAQIGDGRHGFQFRLPDAVRSRRDYAVDVREPGGAPLQHSPFRVREDPDRPFEAAGMQARRFIAAQYCRGDGLEIGALHRPMPLPSTARVRYVDAFPAEHLKTVWTPEVDGHDVVPVDIIADATTLEGIGDAEVDFVIASHVVEHTEDPIRCLFNLLRVVKPAGAVLLIVPDRRRTFDAARPPTSITHVMKDWCGGPEWSRRGHYDEWVRIVERLDGDQAVSRAEKLLADRYAIHFHVWEPAEFTALLAELLPLAPIPFEIDLFKANGPEGIWVLRRLQPERAADTRG